MKKLFLALSFLGFCSCASFWEAVLEKPTVELDRVAVTDADLKGATLVFIIAVENPNSIEIKINRINYKVFVNGKELTQAVMEKSVTIPGKSKGLVELPLPIEYRRIFTDLKDLLFSESASYKIEGEAQLNLFNLPFVKEGSIKLR
jgi:LEA14-like dessication related protein